MVRAVLDDSGRIELPDALRAQLGLKPGDEVFLTERDGEWVIGANGTPLGLCREGNVLVHRGISTETTAEQVLSELRENRTARMSERPPE